MSPSARTPRAEAGMKFASLRNSLCVLLATAFAFTSISSQSETRCPGILPTLHPRIVAGALIVIPVKINQSGPFDFMLDTGSQLNVIDPALAAQLNLKSQGTVGLVAAAAWSQASVGVADSLQVGPQTVLKPLVVTQDLGAIQLEQPLLKRAKVQGSEVSDARRAFAVLPPQDMR